MVIRSRDAGVEPVKRERLGECLLVRAAKCGKGKRALRFLANYAGDWMCCIKSSTAG